MVVLRLDLILFHLERLGDGGLQAQLQLGLCCPGELFVDGRVVAVKGNVGPGRIGEAIKSNFVLRRNSEQKAELQA